MTKLSATVLGLIFTFSFGSVVLSQHRDDSIKHKLGAIKSIKLDENLLTLPCRPGSESCDPLASSNFLVNVELETFKSDKRIQYSFTVTAGKIVGEGTKVVWDLRNTAPGMYTIQAHAVRKGKILPSTKGETVNIVNNICICDCLSCPLIKIGATKRAISAGDNVTVSATISGGSQDNPLTLNWTTSVGSIISGQATSAILIKVPPETKANKLVVTLTIGGLHRACSACVTSESETIELKPLK
jgi:hypothetical protein